MRGQYIILFLDSFATREWEEWEKKKTIKTCTRKRKEVETKTAKKKKILRQNPKKKYDIPNPTVLSHLLKPP